LECYCTDKEKEFPRRYLRVFFSFMRGRTTYTQTGNSPLCLNLTQTMEVTSPHRPYFVQISPSWFRLPYKFLVKRTNYELPCNTFHLGQNPAGTRRHFWSQSCALLGYVSIKHWRTPHNGTWHVSLHYCSLSDVHGCGIWHHRRRNKTNATPGSGNNSLECSFRFRRRQNFSHHAVD